METNAKESEIGEYETEIGKLAQITNEFKSEVIGLCNELDNVKAQARRHRKSIADAQGAPEGSKSIVG